AFDGFGVDRVWIDLNGDGAFDPLTEQFPLGTPITIGGERILIRPDATGTEVRVQPRGSDQGRLKPALVLMPGAVLRSIEASFVNEFGEQAVLRSLDPAVVPAGRYRIGTLRLKVADAAGQLWAYDFHG